MVDIPQADLEEVTFLLPMVEDLETVDLLRLVMELLHRLHLRLMELQLLLLHLATVPHLRVEMAVDSEMELEVKLKKMDFTMFFLMKL